MYCWTYLKSQAAFITIHPYENNHIMPEAAVYFFTYKNLFWPQTFIPLMFHFYSWLLAFLTGLDPCKKTYGWSLLSMLMQHSFNIKTLNLNMFTLFCCKTSLLQFFFLFLVAYTILWPLLQTVLILFLNSTHATPVLDSS